VTAVLLAILTFGFGFGIHTLRFSDQGFIGDSEDYYFFAANLCHEGVLSGDRRIPPEPSAFRAPLLPAVLSTLMIATGDDGFLKHARILQLVLIAFGTAAIFALAHSLFGYQTAVIAGILSAFYFPFIFSSTQLASEPISILLLALCLLAFQLWCRDRTPMMLSVSGLLLGLAALARPNLLFVLFSLTILVLIRAEGRVAGRRLIPVGILILSTLSVILPWTARNLVVMNGFSLISSNGGLNFYLGQTPDFDPSLGAPTTDYRAFQRLRDEGRTELEADRQLYAMGVDLLVSHPGRVAGRVWQKIRALMMDYARFIHPWKFWGLAFVILALVHRRSFQWAAIVGLALVVLIVWTSVNSELPGDTMMLFTTSWTLIWPLMLAGIGLSPCRREKIAPLLLIWTCIITAGVIYIPLARIRWTADAIALIIAAHGLNELRSRLARIPHRVPDQDGAREPRRATLPSTRNSRISLH